jgi:hypothetical protein
MSKGRVFIFDWDADDAAAHAELLRSWDWQVDAEAEDGARGGAAVKLNPPSAVVFYLAHKPSHSRETADYLEQTKLTRNVPLIFVGGEGEALEKVRAKFPNAKFVEEAQLKAALDKAAG